MPKLVDYPRAALKAGLELGHAVDDLGGSSSIEMAAEKLGKKVSGAFNAQISAAAKYGLISAKNQRLTVTPLFREIKLAYNDVERAQLIRHAVLSVPLFREIHARFAGKELPTAHFEKLLVREFGVPDDWASRVASYFIDGAKAANLIGDDNRLVTDISNDVGGEARDPETTGTSPSALTSSIASDTSANTRSIASDTSANTSVGVDTNNYVVRISGPDFNFLLEINEPEDLEIVNAMLRKVAKAVSNAS